MVRNRDVVVFWVVLGLVGCADTTPAVVEFGSLSVVSTAADIDVPVLVKNKKGEVLSNQLSALAVEPAELAVVVQGGKVRCLRNGDVTITGSSGAISAKTILKCRLVSKLKVTPIPRVVVGTPVVVDARALAEDGSKVEDVQVAVSSNAPDVVQVSGLKLVARSVGRASVEVRAGVASASIEVEAVRQLKNEPLLLNDGARINQPLSAGTYEIGVEVRGGEVTLEWVGGEGCEGSGKAREIVRRCRIPESGAVIVENPALLGLFGSGAADGVLRVFEVPAAN